MPFTHKNAVTNPNYPPGPHPLYPAKVGASNDSATIVTARPGQIGQKLVDGTQNLATVQGQVPTIMQDA